MENNNKEKNNEGKKLDQKTRKKIIIAAVILIVLGSLGIAGYYFYNAQRVYVEKAEISAPEILLSSDNGGTLEEVYVKTGDYVLENASIARVGDEIIKTKDAGMVIDVSTNIGTAFSKGQAMATLIDPSALRVVGHVAEDKGLENIKIGQTAIFTVDAFGGKKYYGVVDEISNTARSGDVVFNISDKRQEQEFDVKIRFNINDYPELKNGMSAKLWIYK